MKLLVSIWARPAYVLLSAGISLVVFTIAVWLPNWRLVLTIIPSQSATFAEKVSLLTSLYGSILTNFTTFSALYTITIALLFGVNIVVLVHYVRTTRKIRTSNKGTWTSFGGIVSGFLGVGCASCGTFILTGLLGLFGAAGSLVFLPLGGEEFGLLGIVLLVYSIYTLLKKIDRPLVCSPPSLPPNY